jgi:hypothetical protein
LYDIEIGVVLVRMLKHYVDDHVNGSRSESVAGIWLPGHT